MPEESKARMLARLKDDARARRAAAADAAADGARPIRIPKLGWRPARAAGAVFAAGLAALAVASLFGGDGGSGAAAYEPDAVKVVELPDGSEMILNRGARAVVTGERRVRIVRGDVMLDVARGNGRFVVEAPHGRLEVLGTRFVVAAGEAETRAAVVRGRVEVANASGSAVLRAGEEAVLRDGKAPARRRAPRLSHLAGWAKQARAAVEKPEAGPARRGTLLARNPNWQEQEFPLPMRELSVDVHVENQIARVALDQTFFNPKNQQLEGVYHLALPPDAAIYRQAMYVEGKRMESAVVERRRAREIYDEIVYRRRDPALMEWMAGNLYKVRIFPLPARTEKRILFEYTQPLERLYDDYRIEVPLPAIDSAVDRVSFDVTLVGCASCEVTSTSHDVDTEVRGEELLVTFRAERAEIGDDLVLTVRDPAVAPRVVRASEAGADYLMVRAAPDLADAAGEAPEHRQRRWVILHDTSASRRPLERKAQAHLIDQLLRQLDEDDEVRVMAFDAGVRDQSAGFQRVGDVDRREVAAFLARESADGVGYTDMATALRRAASALEQAGGDAEPFVVYLGDGIVTAGERELEALRRAVEDRATFVGVAVGERMDMRVLRELAAVTGGMTAVMNPGDDLGWRAFDLVAALSTPRVVDLEATLVDGEGEALGRAKVYASRTQLAEGEELSVIAKLGEAAPAALELRGVRDGEAWSQRIPVAGQGTGGAAYLPRLWAQRRVDHLLTRGGEEAQAEITRLGTKQFLVTPHTSLLVLENEKMYRQYGVKQGRGDRWAAYRAPDEIEVVREPLGKGKAAVAGVPLDAMLVRTPTQPLRVYGGYGRRSAGFDRGGLAIDGSLGLEGLGFGGSGTGRGYGGTITTVAEATAEPSDDVAKGKGAAISAIVTTDELAGNAANDNQWTVSRDVDLSVASGAHAISQPVGGARLGDERGPRRRVRTRGDAYRSLVGSRQQRIRLSSSSRISGRYYNGYWASMAPQPAAYHWPGDVKLDDLTEHVPGLFADPFDVELRDLRRAVGSERGSINREARALVRASHRAIGAARFASADGSAVTVDGRGGLRVERTLDVGLGEEILYAGGELWHLYPQLGLATRRDATEAAPLVFDRWAPFLLADVDSLARWYDVTRPEPRTLRLVPAGADGELAIEVELDGERRVRRVVRVDGKQRTVLLTATWSDGGVVIDQGGRELALSIEPGGAPAAVDASAWTVVEMPLRQPAFRAEEVEAASGDDRRRLQRQLLASWAASGNPGELANLAGEMAGDAPLTRGELALASRAARSLGNQQLKDLLAGVPDGDPVAAFLRAANRQRSTQSARAFDRVAKDHDGFVGVMAAYRAALIDVHDSRRRGKAGDRIRALAERGVAPLLLYIATHGYAYRLGYDRTAETIRLWDEVARAMPTPAWRVTALREAARWMYSRQEYAEAAERFEQILTEIGPDQPMPPLDYSAHYAFRQSARGEAGWRLFWGRWRDKALERDDAASLIALAGSATQLGQHRDLDRISARLIEVGTADPGAAARVAQVLNSSGRQAQALAVLEPHLTSDDPDLLALASAIAEQQGRLDEALDYFDRALDGYGDAPVALSVARQDFARMLGILGRLAATSAGKVRDDYLDRAVELAARWRRIDPDNDAIDQQMSRMHYAVGRSEEAWRYLTGAIERHPGEGQAYQTVAEVLEEEGEIAEAEPLWRRAAELDPENPTWLLRRANTLSAMGRGAEASELIDRIVEGDWHERFQNTVYQARRLKEQRK